MIPKSQLPAFVVKAAVLTLFVVGISLFYLFIDFRGLSQAEGMEKATIAREMARGNGFSTKVVRPLALWQARQVDSATTPELIKDTYHAPLYPVVLAGVFATVKDQWAWEENVNLFFLDRVIAATSAIFLIMTAGVAYLLLARLFDKTIAAVSSVLVLVCGTLWEFAQSGLPHVLMVLLFTIVLYLVHTAMLKQLAGRSPLPWLAGTGVAFGLLALTHWLAVWPFIGAVIFVAIYFKPRAISAGLMVAIFAAMTLPWAIRNIAVCGEVLGMAKYVFYGGLGSMSESSMMRSVAGDSIGFSMAGLPSKITLGMLGQINHLYVLLGSVVVAPLFFVSLFHTFRRDDISAFRWFVLLCWGFATMGMAAFGLDLDDTGHHLIHGNQLHILFVPIMTGYGLAFLTVMWGRLNLQHQPLMIAYGHLVLAITISALPFLIQLPRSLKTGLFFQDQKALVNWPPYFPPLYHRFLAENTGENEVCFSDAPWAVAWYADRPSMWIPTELSDLDGFRAESQAGLYDVSGVLLTPFTTHLSFGGEILGQEYGSWKRLITHAGVASMGANLFDQFTFGYPYAHPLTPNGSMTFYADRRRW